ncbi:MAG: efflux RND transporter periplasmic adaptor subunit [Chlorobiaceae bacterium]|nr:efflux RND transporter periplasmic adaptor subunit [Chlorobiaceae bacterium]
MKNTIIISAIVIIIIGLAGLYFYPKIFPSKPERKILYWTDSMIPGDRSDRPGKSPMGMERTPVYADETQPETSSQQTSEEKSYYTCPMHPSVVSDRPGACPVCGMNLVKRTEQEEKSYYTCPMHPSVVSDRPGACPVCGMNLVKRTEQVEMSKEEHQSLGQVALSPTKQVLANVSTSTAMKMSLEKEIRAVGNIAYAEQNFRQISTRFPGRIEKLYLTYEGQQIKKDDPVADVYSPDAISAQQEYLLAKQSKSVDLIQQSKEKLILWGFTESQVKELDESRTVKNTLTLHSPISGTVLKKNVQQQQYVSTGENLFDVADLSTVWMYADVYEYEIQRVKVGQAVEATSDVYPDRKFIGRITFVSPTVDPSSRTVRIRAEITNRTAELKLDMFVNAAIKIKLSEGIVVPITAVLSTGTRQVVWVQKDAGIFEPRLVKIGERSNEYVQILDGINEGETIVTSGGYLIDSESQLEAATGSKTSEHADMKMDK